MITNNDIESNQGTTIPSTIPDSKRKLFDVDLSKSSGDESSSSKSDDDDTTTTKDGTCDLAHNSHGDDNKYASEENKLVNRWRLIVIVSILFVGAIVGSITYVTLSKAQINNSNDAFTLFANSIDDSFQFRVKTLLDANRHLSHDVTVTAKEDGSTFPYHVVPNFETRAFEARKLAAIEAIMYAPIVTDEAKWINFTQNARGWLDESKEWYDILQPGLNRSSEPKNPPLPLVTWTYNLIDQTFAKRVGPEPFAPTFLFSPPPVATIGIFQNVDLFSIADMKLVATAAGQLKDSVFSQFSIVYAGWVMNIIGEKEKENNHMAHPHSIAAQPVYSTMDDSTSHVVGFLFSIVSWNYYLHGLLPEGVNGVHIVLRNSCNQSITYQLHGNEAILIGDGDLHDPRYSHQKRSVDFSSNYIDPVLAADVDGHCQIYLDVYPSEEFNQTYVTPLPIVFTVVIGLLFLLMAAIFAIYDRFVHSRNSKVMNDAARSNAIVSSLFPEAIRGRLLAQQEQDDGVKSKNLKGFLTANKSEWNKDDKVMLFETKPIADLFPETTVIFADIVNFTSWSSVRDPSQVFTLLEVVYNAFDEIARKRGVFKVETIGDCYVAVCGLPEPAKDHAVRMSRFAKDCMHKMKSLVKELENTLGPDTCDLTMRMGLHSGPVTAGVLRGERSRFQLFGDTMNTAARMESTGFPDCIQISQVTADLLVAAGKQAWMKPRAEMVNAKGKGLMQTYLLEMTVNRSAANSSSGGSSVADPSAQQDDFGDMVEIPDPADKNCPLLISSKNDRLVRWIKEILMVFVKDIAARRIRSKDWKRKSVDEMKLKNEIGYSSILEEVKEIVMLPSVHDNDVGNAHSEAEIDPAIREELRHYLATISLMYPENPFHSFEHAAHVTMSVQKLLARIIAPSDSDEADDVKSLGADNTYGITSDPLTQFSCVFSAVIHDVDHPGVPNGTLVAEQTPLATKYNNKSIAEQNSVDLAWNLLMKDKYKTLRAAIYSNEEEMHRFRQLIVNSVMATDIADKDQKVFRNARWDRAFHEKVEENEQDSINRKATIVIEHLIQASDVAHTMQHWHIYRKWNQRFFEECYRAYKMGRTDVDPSLNWFEGEIGFFDYYIIPLAKKLKDCGVFGVSSDEYLNYAMQNRNEWKDCGQELVHELVERECNKWNTGV